MKKKDYKKDIRKEKGKEENPHEASCNLILLYAKRVHVITSSHGACMFCLNFHTANHTFKFRKRFKFTKQTTAHLTIRHFFQLKQIAFLTICQTTKKKSKTKSA